MHITIEEWRSVVGHDGYQVSNVGNVRSINRTVRGRRYKGKPLKPGIASNGYPTVAIGKDNTKTVHSLVASAFIGPCPPGQEVRHKDGNRKNPRHSNLEYGTRTENIYDAMRHGTWNHQEFYARNSGF